MNNKVFNILESLQVNHISEANDFSDYDVIGKESQKIIKSKKDELELLDLYGDLKKEDIDLFKDGDRRMINRKHREIVKDSLINWATYYLDQCEENPDEIVTDVFYKGKKLDNNVLKLIERDINHAQEVEDFRKIASNIVCKMK